MTSSKIQFKVHPRVFAALGAELVTDDIVAAIELVKNSYDAFASSVIISLSFENGGKCLSIIDDGEGMSRDIIENVWSTIATPYKLNNPFSLKDTKKRRVTGEKGLGRFSAARLGSYFEMITKSKNDKAWKITLDWENILSLNEIESCQANIEEFTGELPFQNDSQTGTAIYISNLSSDWNDQLINSLKENLARLKSPFSTLSDFDIYFLDHVDYSNIESNENDLALYQINPPDFLYKPKYSIKGNVKKDGSYHATYEFRPIITGEIARTEDIKKTWKQIRKDVPTQNRTSLSDESATCGPFEFEIRAWDLGKDDTFEISEKYGVARNTIRKDIGRHKGISVYRDDILVLPKNDTSRDWLKLDPRRVSKVGKRISTSNSIGFIAITADENPNIIDSSDREKLKTNLASEEFETIVLDIIYELEHAREIDRITQEKPLQHLFEALEGKKLADGYRQLVNDDASQEELTLYIEDHATSLENSKTEMVRRFTYYSRLASIGSIAQILVHEIRNNTTIIGRFLRLIENEIKQLTEELNEFHHLSTEGIDRLEGLSDRFAPLASRSFSTKKRSSNLLQRVSSCLDLLEDEIKGKNTKLIVEIPENITLSVDPAELDTIFINLLTNALFWIDEVEPQERHIQIKAKIRDKRVELNFDDSGPGIKEEYVDKIFLPGITSRKEGFGMGLTIASEIIYGYKGNMAAVSPGAFGGVSFLFDLPLRGNK